MTSLRSAKSLPTNLSRLSVPTLESLSLYMCGIWLSVSRGGIHGPDHHVVSTLKSRGPDAFQSVSVSVQSQSVEYSLKFCASVLALRGSHIQEQPLVDSETGSILCWNGEVWKKDGSRVTGNDSLLVLNTLVSAAESGSPSSCITQALTTLIGPFAFVFYDATSSTVYYGRDRLGRRSLMLQTDPDGNLVLCSVSEQSLSKPKEVSTDHLHALTFLKGSLDIQPIPWPTELPIINASIPDAAANHFIPNQESLTSLLYHLTESMKLRVLNIPDHGSLHQDPTTTKVAILFSGGLDCTLLARLAHDILPVSSSIDLLNVAFENPRAMKTKANGESPYEICPDRITGRSSFAELSQICPNRCWRFVAIDVPYSEVQSHKPMIIHLMKPHNTEMDLSIAMALYFAARGQGAALSSIHPCNLPQSYTTPARVLLSGLGADELFGGYSRHAAAFARAGYLGLIEELNLDFSRIGSRNLGRDDRVISHCGKEVRYPYLDEDFTHFALGLPVWEKCGFRPGRDIPKHHEDGVRAEKVEDLEPSKTLLRIALWNLGMGVAAAERKRAIQFGAKTAKMEGGSGRTKGTGLLVDE